MTFTEFFAGDFQRELEACTIPGMDTPSWDRRAAYLLWLARGNKPIVAPKRPRVLDLDDVI